MSKSSETQRTLVAAAVRRAERDAAVDAVTAAFDRSLEAFYTDLGFDLDRDGSLI
ncbi:MAG: hypothetical protein R6U40_00910 [Desulfobacterales bacterium]